MIDLISYFVIYILPVIVLGGALLFVVYFGCLYPIFVCMDDDSTMEPVPQATIEKNLIKYGVDSD